MEITYDIVRSDPEVVDLIRVSNDNLGEIGYTEHGDRHLEVVAERAKKLLLEIGRDDRTAELAAIAAHLHDIGNSVNRIHHAITGAILAKSILVRLGMPFAEVHKIIGAIGNHHEGEGDPVSDIAAALVLADKSDVHKSRVRATGDIISDIHDRVNYAVTNSDLYVKNEGEIIGVELLIDPKVSSVMEYFEIFLDRMNACKSAAEYLGAKFELIVNGVKLA